MSSTSAPRERSLTGRLRPCSIGPTATTWALRCTACHHLPGQPQPLPAPALDTAKHHLRREWMIDWLSRSPEQQETANESAGQGETLARRMPHFALNRDDATALTAWLWSASQPLGKPTQTSDPPASSQPKSKSSGSKKKSNEKPREPSAQAGARMVQTLGCLACHQVNGTGRGGLLGGGDLSQVAAKRQPEFFSIWLSDPARLNVDHRMPIFRLSKVERDDLVLYLRTLDKQQPGGSAQPASDENKSTDAMLARGKQLAAAHRCGACHRLPEEVPPAAVKSRTLAQDASWDDSCLGAPDAARHVPGFGLSESARQDLRTFVSSLAPGNGDAPTELDGRFVMAERNCLSCHARGIAPGLAEVLPQVAAHDPELAPLLPALAPPALNSVGDKLHEDWLLAAIETREAPLRPWLSVRMPKFNLSPAEKQALVGYLVALKITFYLIIQ